MRASASHLARKHLPQCHSRTFCGLKRDFSADDPSRVYLVGQRRLAGFSTAHTATVNFHSDDSRPHAVCADEIVAGSRAVWTTNSTWEKEAFLALAPTDTALVTHHFAGRFANCHAQQRLNFRPLPQKQGSFRPGRARCGVMLAV